MEVKWLFLYTIDQFNCFFYSVSNIIQNLRIKIKEIALQRNCFLIISFIINFIICDLLRIYFKI